MLRLDNTEQVQLTDFKGSLFENMMIAEYIKRMHHCNQLNDIWFWRDVAGNEVDLIINPGTTQEAVEFKATQTIMPNLFKGLNFLSLTPKSSISLKTRLLKKVGSHYTIY